MVMAFLSALNCLTLWPTWPLARYRVKSKNKTRSNWLHEVILFFYFNRRVTRTRKAAAYFLRGGEIFAQISPSQGADVKMNCDFQMYSTLTFTTCALFYSVLSTVAIDFCLQGWRLFLCLLWNLVSVFWKLLPTAFDVTCSSSLSLPLLLLLLLLLRSVLFFLFFSTRWREKEREVQKLPLAFKTLLSPP